MALNREEQALDFGNKGRAELSRLRR